MKGWWLFILLFFVAFSSVKAQGNYLGYDMSGIPQASYYNPAFTPNAKVFVGIPVISNINIGYYNTSFAFDDIFISQPGTDSLYLDLSRLANDNEPVNYISESATIDLLSVGFKAGSAFVTLGANTNVNTRFFYDNDLIRLAWEGNGSSINDDFVLAKTAVYEEHYNKYFAGLSMPVGRKVRVGIRGSFIQGLSSIYSENRDLVLTTKVDTIDGVYLDGRTDYDVNTSAIAYLFGDSATMTAQDYFLNFQSRGFSIDVGVDVKINDHFSFQLSATNLGFITWRSYDKTYSSAVKDVYFSGVDYDLFADDNDDPLENYLDALDSIFNVNESVKTYSTNLRANIFANGQYTLFNKKHRFNLLFAGRFLEHSFEYAFSVGYTYNPAGKFSAKLTYTYMEYSPLNLGAGFFFNFKPFQFYIMADNVVGMIMWYDQRFVDIRFGFNILIPAKKRSHEIPAQYMQY
jgi:hypothetical protein